MPAAAPSWEHHVKTWAGHYDNGSFYYSGGRHNYFIQWTQHEPATDAANIYFNIVSVLPLLIEQFTITDHGLAVRRGPPPVNLPVTDPCGLCPPMSLTFYASKAGPVDIQLGAGGRVLDSFTATAAEGVNVIRVGSPERAQVRPPDNQNFTVTVRAHGQPGQLTRTIIPAETLSVPVQPSRGASPPQPIRRTVRPTQERR